MSNERRLVITGAILSVIGLLVVVTGLVANLLMTGNSGSASFGGVVMIGPIPLIFGSDRTALLIAVVGAVILILAASATMYIGMRKAPTSRQEHQTTADTNLARSEPLLNSS
jgi:uncharacterized protein (TIGR00304 family)